MIQKASGSADEINSSVMSNSTEREVIPAPDRFEQSLLRLITWVRKHEYRAYEPADGNASIFFPLTMGRVWPMRLLQQLVLRSPINIRPLLGVQRHESAIGRGYMAWGYIVMSRHQSTAVVVDEARSCLQWLMVHRAQGHDDFCWGDPYDYATRGGRRPFGAPLLIWTALIGQAFLDAFTVLGDEAYLEVARSCGRWILKLPSERTTSGACLSYNAYSQSSIHNSNAMGAAFLARLAALTGSSEARTAAEDAMTYTCVRQREDGAWFYGEEPKYHWIDNFHTGYNLSALHVYRRAFAQDAFDRQFIRGLEYFKTSFFEPNGAPKYFHDRVHPIDIQCAAQAIDTLVSVSNVDPTALLLATKVADWTISNMQAADGHFNYRQLGWITVTTPMLHWGQATMVKALALLVERLTQHIQSRAMTQRSSAIGSPEPQPA